MIRRAAAVLGLSVFLAVGSSAGAASTASDPGNGNPVAETELWDARNEFASIHFTRVSVALHGSYAYVSAVNGEAGGGAFLRKSNGLWHVRSSEKGAFSPGLFAGSGVASADDAAVVIGGCPPLRLAPGETMTVDQRRLAAHSSQASIGPQIVTAMDGQSPRHYRASAVAYRICNI